MGKRHVEESDTSSNLHAGGPLEDLQSSRKRFIAERYVMSKSVKRGKMMLCSGALYSTVYSACDGGAKLFTTSDRDGGQI